MKRINDNSNPVGIRNSEDSNESKAVNSIEESGSNPTPHFSLNPPHFLEGLFAFSVDLENFSFVDVLEPSLD
jgi:hypothetical protein